MYHTAPSPHHGQHPHSQQGGGRMPPSSPAYAPGPSTQQHYAPGPPGGGAYYTPQQGSFQPAPRPAPPTPAVPHHSLFLKIHSYTPSSITDGPPGGELVVSCRLFPQATAPQTSNIIRLCFGSYPLATRVARNLQPQPPSAPMEPGQELLLRCDIPSWDELVDKGTVQPGEAARVYLFCEVLRPNQVPGQAEHVLQRVWYGEFDFHGGAGGWAGDDRAMHSQQRRQQGYAPPMHVAPSKRAGSPLTSPRRQSPQFYHRQQQPYTAYETQHPQYAQGPVDYGGYPGQATEYDQGFEVQVEGGYYHPEGGHPPPPRHLHPSQQHGQQHPPSAPPHLISPTTPVFPHHPPSPSSMHTPTRQTYASGKGGKTPVGHHPQQQQGGGLAWGPAPSANPSVILPPNAGLGLGEIDGPYTPSTKAPPAPITVRPQTLAAPQVPGQLVRNLQPKSPKGPPTKKPKSAGASAAAAAAAASAPTTTTTVTNNGLSTTTTMKAKLELHGNLEAMALGWSRPEFENRRRLVQFWRKQVGATIEVAYKPVDQAEWQKDTIVISCIWRLEKNECYVTSVDTIYLLEAIIGNRFTVEEKNRIRRNLEGLKPDTISKNKEETKDFFEIIMGFPDPKPRHIEKDVKVFKWEKLAEALTKIISKYSVAYNGPAPAAPPSNPIPGPLRAPPVEEGSGQIGTIPLPAPPAPQSYPAPPPQPAPSTSYTPATSSQRDYSHPPSGAYSQDPTTRAYTQPLPPPPPGAYPATQPSPARPSAQRSQTSQSSDYYAPAGAPASSSDVPLEVDVALLQPGGDHDFAKPNSLSIPLSFEFSEYFSTETPPPAPMPPMPPVDAPNNPLAASSSAAQAPAQAQQASSSGLSYSTTAADYSSPHRPTPPSGGGSATSPSSAAPLPSQLVDPAILRRPASEPPTMSGGELQPSPYSTLSYDGVATATPEPVEQSALAAHELAGIGLDLGDTFDFDLGQADHVQ